MTFKEANEKEIADAFGCDFVVSICDGCRHSDECFMSDFKDDEYFDLESRGVVVVRCNFFKGNSEGI